jgi:hypothetical protein
MVSKEINMVPNVRNISFRPLARPNDISQQNWPEIIEHNNISQQNANNI